MHAPRQRLLGRLQKKVIVRRHQAVGVTHAEKGARRHSHLGHKIEAVRLIDEEGAAADSPSCHMKEAVLEKVPGTTRHEP